MGIASPMNMLFFLGFCFSLTIIFSLTISASKMSIQIKDLTQEIALYKKEQNEKVDEIAETLSTTYDKEKHVELMKEMEQEILNDGAYAFFANQKLICVYNKKVTGFEINPSEYYLITNNIDIAE